VRRIRIGQKRELTIRKSPFVIVAACLRTMPTFKRVPLRERFEHSWRGALILISCWMWAICDSYPAPRGSEMEDSALASLSDQFGNNCIISAALPILSKS
jgi:hypothetical protein